MKAPESKRSGFEVDDDSARRLLKNSGYFKTDDDYDSKFSSPEEEEENAILNFQDFNGLEPTGRLDKPTKELFRNALNATSVSP